MNKIIEGYFHLFIVIFSIVELGKFITTCVNIDGIKLSG